MTRQQDKNNIHGPDRRETNNKEEDGEAKRGKYRVGHSLFQQNSGINLDSISPLMEGRYVAVARNQYERMGNDITMQCGSLDNDASVSWKVNGTDVKALHHLEGPRLILTQVGLGHNGLYSCFQNPHGERRDTILLHIGEKPSSELLGAGYGKLEDLCYGLSCYNDMRMNRLSNLAFTGKGVEKRGTNPCVCENRSADLRLRLSLPMALSSLPLRVGKRIANPYRFLSVWYF
ncbi:unnamed protein product [Menidia menidia]|uniref:(Atlantic silverside) hypothetical protein n=1 Tax=Menidia menidia TaxID=238744 RepID=A0A8S4AK04_9TELE|nr:unnamed protein product [Menidia menidia]